MKPTIRVFGHYAVTLTPHQRWRVDTFGADADDPLVAADNANPDEDELTNLEEWAYGTSALRTSVAPIRGRFGEEGESPGFRLVVNRNPDATDVTFTVQVSSNLGSGSWTTTGLVIEEDSATRLVVRDILGGPQRFLRLVLTRAP